jgi:hypothetical protein
MHECSQLFYVSIFRRRANLISESVPTKFEFGKYCLSYGHEFCIVYHILSL